jgi:hypothetical protein
MLRRRRRVALRYVLIKVRLTVLRAFYGANFGSHLVKGALSSQLRFKKRKAVSSVVKRARFFALARYEPSNGIAALGLRTTNDS